MGGCLARGQTFDIGGRSIICTDMIARGGFSFVYHGEDKKSKEKFALKKILAQTSEQLEETKWEVKVHRTFDHPNLLPLVGYLVQQAPKGSGQEVILLFPYHPQTLFSIIYDAWQRPDDPWPFTEGDALYIFEQICGGLSAFHESNWAHRDIKVL